MLAICFDNIDDLFAGEARLDAILIHGVDNMSTKDVFAYFGDFAPGSVEWIDDSSCKSVCSIVRDNFQYWNPEHLAPVVAKAG